MITRTTKITRSRIQVLKGLFSGVGLGGATANGFGP
jgi:hypothetical protein